MGVESLNHSMKHFRLLPSASRRCEARRTSNRQMSELPADAHAFSRTPPTTRTHIVCSAGEFFPVKIAQEDAVMPSQNESVDVWHGRPPGLGPCALAPVDSDVASFSAGFSACGPG